MSLDACEESQTSVNRHEMCKGEGVSVGHFEILKKMVWHSRPINDVLAGRKSDRMGFIFGVKNRTIFEASC